MASLLRTETVTYGGVSFTLQCSTIRINVERNDLLKRLNGKLSDDGDFVAGYADVVANTLNTSGLEFQLPPASADADAHLASYAAYSQLPLDLHYRLIGVLIRLNMPPGDPNLAAGVKTKSPKSAPPEANNSPA